MDEHIAAHDRVGALTALAKAATTIGTPEIVGAGLMTAVPVILRLARRLDAAKVFCIFAGASTFAEIGKKIVAERRPPVSLQAMAADAGPSYPSGHATTAVLAVALVVIAAALVLGGLYAVAVAASRVYPGDHYPAGMLCALAAAFVVTGLAALPGLQPYRRRLAAPSRRRHR